MAKKQVTLDLLTESGKNILDEKGTSFLIVKRDWIEISISGGGGRSYIEYDWAKDRYVWPDGEPRKLTIIIRHNGREWINEYMVTNRNAAVKILYTLRSIADKMSNVKVFSQLTKYYHKTIEILARKR